MTDGDHISADELAKCQQSNWANRRRADAAEGQLARLLALLEDRESIARLFYESHFGVARFNLWPDALPSDKENWYILADRLASYIKDKLNA